MKHPFPIHNAVDFETDVIGCPHCGLFVMPERTEDTIEFICNRCAITSVVHLDSKGTVRDRIQEAVNRFNKRRIC